MSKMLIVYYSQARGNTKRIAQMLQDATGADMAEIQRQNHNSVFYTRRVAGSSDHGYKISLQGCSFQM